jgi:hypothetical protein
MGWVNKAQCRNEIASVSGRETEICGSSLGESFDHPIDFVPQQKELQTSYNARIEL